MDRVVVVLKSDAVVVEVKDPIMEFPASVIVLKSVAIVLLVTASVRLVELSVVVL
jgi:hypothetical protein